MTVLIPIGLLSPLQSLQRGTAAKRQGVAHIQRSSRLFVQSAGEVYSEHERHAFRSRARPGVKERRVDALVSDEDLARRRQQLPPPKPVPS